VLADQGITGRTDSPFTDVRVREAMQLAVDYDAINERLFDGVGIADSALVPPDSPVYHDMEGPPYDPDRAEELVQELTSEGTWDGVINLLVPNTPEGVEMGVLFEAMWEAVGMTVNVEQAPIQDQTRRVILDRDFEVSTNGFAILDPAPWSTVNGLATDSQRQRTGYSNPDMDAALEQLRAASTIDETKEALAEVQEVWNETFPLLVWNHSVWAILVADHVHGMEYGPDATPYFHRAWVEE
jgi:peptide/nickel transport system substrate-binding protein